MKHKVVETIPFSLAMPNEPVYVHDFADDESAWEDAVYRMASFIGHHGDGCCRVQYVAGVEYAKAEEAETIRACEENSRADEMRLCDERRAELDKAEFGSEEFVAIEKKYAARFASLDRTREAFVTETKARWNGVKHSWGVEFKSDLVGFVDRVRKDMREHGVSFAKFNMIVNRRASRATGPDKNLVVFRTDR